MSESIGWISIHRKMCDNEMWTFEPFSRAQAWIDLLLLTNHEEGKIIVRGNMIKIKRGQCGWSKLRLSKRWKWSCSKVSRFLNYLENEQQIEQQKDFVTSIITITNYHDYQKREQQNEQQTNSRRTADEQQTNTNNNVNNNNNENNKEKAVSGKKSKKAKKEEKPLIFPDCLERSLLESYIQNRIDIKKPMTHRAKELFLSKAEKFHEAGQDVKVCIENAIIGGWTDIYTREGKGKVKCAQTKSGEPHRPSFSH